MKKLEVKEIGNPILRKRAKKASLKFVQSKKGKELIQNMIFTMRKTNGIGLAAPQVGEPIQLVVLEIRPTKMRPKLKKEGPFVVVNPRITSYSKEKVSDWEGCLSFKGYVAKVPRSKSITVSYHDEKGIRIVKKVSDLWARMFQHEIDHLNGFIYVDRVVDTKSYMTRAEYMKPAPKKKKK